jgi:S1-C subfamily serine protease
MHKGSAILALFLMVTANAALGHADDEPKVAFMGVRLTSLDQGDGVLVVEIVADSPAAKAGLKVEDVILMVGNVAAKDHTTVVETIRMFTPGDRVNVQYRRGGKEQTVTVTLAAKSKDS